MERTDANPEANATAADIKRRIMLDIKTAGKRLGADQMRVRYGAEGPVAERVIRELSGKGLLLEEAPSRAPSAGSTAGADGIVRAVSDLEYRIEDEIRRGLGEVLSSRRRRHEALRSRRRAEPSESDQWERKLAESSFTSTADGIEDYDDYERKIRREARGASAGFIGHLIPFAAVNGGLMALNAAVSPSFPWAIFPFGGWGIGLLEHYVSGLRKKEKLKELMRLPPLDGTSLPVFKALQKQKDSFWLHLASTFSVSAFLGGVNLVVSPGFLWFLFPAAAMLIGLLSHGASYSAKRNELSEELRSLLGPADRKRKPASRQRAPEADAFGPYRPLVEEARSIRDALAASAAPSKGGKRKKGDALSALDADLLSTVDSYLEQVVLLAERTREADLIIDQIPMDAVRADKAALKAKLEGTAGESLRREYGKSLEELERQERSFEGLREQREILELRLRSSVNTLKQLRIDTARLSGLNEGGESAAVNALRGKTAELNRYLDDLRAGYAEIDALEGRLPETDGGSE